MIKRKRHSDADVSEQAPVKKINTKTSVKSTKFKPNSSKSQLGSKPQAKSLKRLYNDKMQGSNAPQEKPNWKDFKKEKKELKLKRKKSKGSFDTIVEAKMIAEKLRQKSIEGGTQQRNALLIQLHNLLGGKEFYSKLILAHDMARVVQYLLKFGSENIRNSIAKEIIPLSTEMLLSKYGRYCFKNMLKYGNNEVRSKAIEKLNGNAVKLCSHVVSSSIFEYAFSTWASPRQKLHFIQEFFGDLYKQIKDDSLKHLRDVYKNDDSLKTAALNTTKSNLSRVFNKSLFDSGLVQSVLYMYMSECTATENTELIAQLVPHAVVLSNSRDGARVVMRCIWNGSTKEKKSIVKGMKENLIELCKHEHAHCAIIALLDSVDDTVLVNKTLVALIVTNATSLVTNEWGRKVLLWLVAPGDTTHFHPTFINELNTGQDSSTSRKDSNTRRNEILSYCSTDFLKYLIADAQFWLSTPSIALVTLAILKSGTDISEALQSISQIICNPEWKIKELDKECLGIEHPGLHMALKKLAQHDKVMGKSSFGEILVNCLSDTTIKAWLGLNRGCFLFVTVYENGNKNVQQEIKEKLAAHIKFIKKQTSSGAKLLLKKLE